MNFAPYGAFKRRRCSAAFVVVMSENSTSVAWNPRGAPCRIKWPIYHGPGEWKSKLVFRTIWSWSSTKFTFDGDDSFITFSVSLLWPPSFLKCSLVGLCTSAVVFSHFAIVPSSSPPAPRIPSHSRRLMEDFWSNLSEYWLWAILIQQYIIPRRGGRFHDTCVGFCNGG